MATQSPHRSYYDVLHVSRDAPAEIIRGSYRTLMQQLKKHPDLGGDTATAALINEAYAVLTNDERRAEYDAHLALAAGIASEVVDEAPAPEVAEPPPRLLDPFRECIFCEAPHNHGRVIEPDAGCRSCGSPLCMAKNQRMESAGKRAVARFDKRQHIAFFTRWPQRKGYVGQTKDVSLNGMRFETRRNLLVGQRLKIVSSAIEAVANVTHCMQERQGIRIRCVAGVSFVTLRFVRSVGGFVSDRV